MVPDLQLVEGLENRRVLVLGRNRANVEGFFAGRVHASGKGLVEKEPQTVSGRGKQTGTGHSLRPRTLSIIRRAELFCRLKGQFTVFTYESAPFCDPTDPARDRRGYARLRVRGKRMLFSLWSCRCVSGSNSSSPLRSSRKLPHASCGGVKSRESVGKPFALSGKKLPALLHKPFPHNLFGRCREKRELHRC